MPYGSDIVTCLVQAHIIFFASLLVCELLSVLNGSIVATQQRKIIRHTATHTQWNNLSHSVCVEQMNEQNRWTGVTAYSLIRVKSHATISRTYVNHANIGTFGTNVTQRTWISALRFVSDSCTIHTTHISQSLVARFGVRVCLFRSVFLCVSIFLSLSLFHSF